MELPFWRSNTCWVDWVSWASCQIEVETGEHVFYFLFSSVLICILLAIKNLDHSFWQASNLENNNNKKSFTAHNIACFPCYFSHGFCYGAVKKKNSQTFVMIHPEKKDLFLCNKFKIRSNEGTKKLTVNSTSNRDLHTCGTDRVNLMQCMQTIQYLNYLSNIIFICLQFNRCSLIMWIFCVLFSFALV